MVRTLLGVLWERQLALQPRGSDTFVRGESPDGPPERPATPPPTDTKVRGESSDVGHTDWRAVDPDPPPDDEDVLTRTRGEGVS